MASPTQEKTLTLSATYASPSSEPFTTARELPAPPSGTDNPTVPDKTAYLAALRAAVTSAQADINRELTLRMDEDNARARSAASNGKSGAGVVDEAKEEENYGEEAQGEED